MGTKGRVTTTTKKDGSSRKVRTNAKTGNRTITKTTAKGKTTTTKRGPKKPTNRIYSGDKNTVKPMSPGGKPAPKGAKPSAGGRKPSRKSPMRGGKGGSAGGATTQVTPMRDPKKVEAFNQGSLAKGTFKGKRKGER